jgi:hypothetical protein
MLWDDFEGGSNGNAVTGPSGGVEPIIHQGNLSSYNQWVRGGGGNYANESIVFNNTNPKMSSGLHASAIFDDNAFWGLDLSIDYPNFTSGNELYISFYYRFRNQSASFGRQTKAWIAWPPTGGDKAYWTNSFGTCQEGDYWRIHRTEDAEETALSPGLSATGIDNEWVRFESYLKQSSPGVANGAWHQVVYRPSLGTPVKHQIALDNYKLREMTDEWVEWTFGGAYYDMCDPTNTATIDVDDFYMDSTRARVEVCDSPTWASRTRCELQLPTAWSDASITATFKKGYLPSSTTAYVYVINAAGNVNAAGFPIVIGP